MAKERNWLEQNITEVLVNFSFALFQTFAAYKTAVNWPTFTGTFC